IGISKEDMPNIFLPFRQIRPKAHVGTGLGIGLSLSKRLVEMHGGEIRAESEGLGLGSTFVVTFPISRRKESVTSNTGLYPETNREKIMESGVRSTQQFRVLVVDDNKSAADGLGKLLKIKGHTTSYAYDGVSALRAVK